MIVKSYNNGSIKVGIILVVVFSSVLVVFTAMWFLPADHITYSSSGVSAVIVGTATTTEEVVIVPTHIQTPEVVKAVYMTACVAGTPSLRTKMLSLFEGTELNSLVVDLKDYTGTISYASTKVAVPSQGKGCRIADLPEFINELHALGIYVIARITVFQDTLYASSHPKLAVQSLSKPDGIWRDKNNLAYIDPGAPDYWDYIVDISKEAYSIGFDELNFDYIRFPSDGDLADISYSWSTGRQKREVLRDFFTYLDLQLASTSAPLSADLFGLTTSSKDDLGIGQVLEDALPYFDFIAPMVYPSHFSKGYNGIAKPAEQPYNVIKSAMTRAVERAIIASTTPLKLRPWLQDFNLGATYTPAMVRAQMQATYDSGLTSWMLWNASNRYQRDALAEKGVVDVMMVKIDMNIASSTNASTTGSF